MDTSLQSIIEIALRQGIWAALYIYLFFHMLKENAEREKQYQLIISNLGNIIKKELEDIKNRLDDIENVLPYTGNKSAEYDAKKV